MAFFMSVIAASNLPEKITETIGGKQDGNRMETLQPFSLLAWLHITQHKHVHNKKSNKGGGKSDFPYSKELLRKERLRSLWEQILSFKRNSFFEAGSNGRESLLNSVVSL